MTAVARVALAMSLALGVGVATLAVASYSVVASSLAADTDRTLLREAEAFSAAVAASNTSATPVSLADASRQYLAARAQSSSGALPILTVRLSTGRVLSNSDIRLELAPGNTAPPARGFANLEYDGEEYRVATTPIVNRTGMTIGVFQAALSTTYTRAISANLAGTLGLAGLIIVILGVSISAWVARATLRPLREVAGTAERIGQNSLEGRVPYTGPSDEVGSMVASLNAMLDRLEAAFGEQRRFVADASHELRTPLAVLRGNVDLIEHAKTTDEQKATSLAIMRDELARLERLVNDLLALARLEAGPTRPFQPLDVATLLLETAGRAYSLGDRQFSVDANVNTWTLGDPDLLEQALMNLTRNAVTHTTVGGHIELAATAHGKEVCITIADDGPGLRREDLPHVFDRFYRGRGPRGDAGGGSGLGLAITRRLIELHGGSVEAANRPEGGAVFTISLPRTGRPRD
ncbi:MAG: sensor histidine kinase [Coriobacteriia bacterium]